MRGVSHLKATRLKGGEVVVFPKQNQDIIFRTGNTWQADKNTAEDLSIDPPLKRTSYLTMDE